MFWIRKQARVLAWPVEQAEKSIDERLVRFLAVELSISITNAMSITTRSVVGASNDRVPLRREQDRSRSQLFTSQLSLLKHSGQTEQA